MGRANKKTQTSNVKMKVVRVDSTTLIEVPEHIADEVAIERYQMRHKIGARPIVIAPKIIQDDPELPDLPEIEEPEEEIEED